MRFDARGAGLERNPEEREAEAEAARAVLGASWRTNLRWPDGGIDGNDVQMMDVVRLVRTVRPRTVALPHSNDRHPDHRAASDVLTRAAFKSGLRRFGDADSSAWRPDWLCYYFINDSDPVSFALDVSEHYDKKREALACHRSQFTPAGPGSIETRLTAPSFRQMIESRDAHLGARTGVAFAEGVDRARSAPAPAPVQGLDRLGEPRRDRVNVGIVCYASVGGSGIVATELAKSLAARGHDVHVLSADTPFRFGAYQARPEFPPGATPAYPLFREPQYVLALATRVVQVSREFKLDIVHAHYAVPHATAAYLARQILQSAAADRVPKVITTLHGTDITLVGSDHSYAETVAFSIDQSDGVTAVSESLQGGDLPRAAGARTTSP